LNPNKPIWRPKYSYKKKDPRTPEEGRKTEENRGEKKGEKRAKGRKKETLDKGQATRSRRT
jgi:hypothetical protein